MEDLKIQFTHAVQGKIQLRRKQAEKEVKVKSFRSDKDFTFDIDIKGLADGDWTASLEWNHDNQPFLIEKHFKIVDGKWIQ